MGLKPWESGAVLILDAPHVRKAIEECTDHIEAQAARIAELEQMVAYREAKLTAAEERNRQLEAQGRALLHTKDEYVDLVRRLKAQLAEFLDNDARYRWLRDDNAYFPEENRIKGGVELDAGIDAMRAAATTKGMED